MAGKFLDIVNGVLTQISAIASSAGAGDADKLIKLDSAGRIDNSMMPVGIGADTKSMTTSEDLSAGNIVNVYDNTGETARKADATAAGKRGVGFVLASSTSGNNATVYFEGTITGLSGLTPGAAQYLDTTAGGLTETAPSGSGNVVQRIGTAISATEVSFEPEIPVTLA